MKSDANKGISLIEYNTYLNKVKQVTWSDGRWLKFNYDGTGSLLKKENSAGEYWDYVGDLIYKNGNNYSINNPEGRIVFTNNSWNYEYDYRDIWGNLRLSFASENGQLKVKQQSDYDPLGYTFNQFAGVNKNVFKYQKQQRIEDFDLNIDFFKFRPSDPTIGRFWMVDPLSSDYAYNSVYALQENKFGSGVELEGKELGSFYQGVMDAVFEDSAPVATQYVKTNGNSSYNSGAKAGHYLSMALGGLQIGVGVVGDALAGTAEVSTAGLATPAAFPIATGSTALIVSGAATIVKAAANLNSEGKNGGSFGAGKDTKGNGTSNSSLKNAKEQNGIPKSQQPDKTIKSGTPEGDRIKLDSRNVKQYQYTNSKGEKINIRQDKPANYGQNNVGNQKSHFNAGKGNNEKLKQHHYD